MGKRSRDQNLQQRWADKSAGRWMTRPQEGAGFDRKRQFRRRQLGLLESEAKPFPITPATAIFQINDFDMFENLLAIFEEQDIWWADYGFVDEGLAMMFRNERDAIRARLSFNETDG